MRKKLILMLMALITLCLLTVSCSKSDEEDKPKPLDTSTFVGKWVSYDVQYKDEEESHHEATNRYNFQFTDSKAKLVLGADEGSSTSVEEYVLDYTLKDNVTISWNFKDKTGQDVTVLAKLTKGQLYRRNTAILGLGDVVLL